MAEDRENPDSFRVTDRRGQPKEEPPKAEPKKEATPERKPPSPPPVREAPADHEAVDFSSFILSLSTSALLHMGLIKDPEGPDVPKNLPLAKQEIDILEMLQKKTRNNLTKQEEGLFEEVLYELRLRFVEASR
ncbi:MAG: DUF1844 domain-containing protein [Pseudomonadota bacterium]